MKKTILTLSFYLIGLLIYAQSPNKSGNYYFKGVYHTGKILNHSPDITPFINNKTKTFTLSISKQHYGDKDWQYHFRFPETGLALNYTDFGNKPVLGSAISFYYFINVPIFRTRFVNLHYQLGIGGALHSKYYISTPENIVIGTPFGEFLNVRLDAKLKLSENLFAVGGLGFLHYSNGRVKIPNIGINIVAYHAGFVYFMQNSERKFVKKDFPEFKGKNEFSLIHAYGYKEINPIGGKKYITSSFTVNYERHLSYRRKAGFGFDVFYDNS